MADSEDAFTPRDDSQCTPARISQGRSKKEFSYKVGAASRRSSGPSPRASGWLVDSHPSVQDDHENGEEKKPWPPPWFPRCRGTDMKMVSAKWAMEHHDMAKILPTLFIRAMRMLRKPRPPCQRATRVLKTAVGLFPSGNDREANRDHAGKGERSVDSSARPTTPRRTNHIAELKKGSGFACRIKSYQVTGPQRITEAGSELPARRGEGEPPGKKMCFDTLREPCQKRQTRKSDPKSVSDCESCSICPEVSSRRISLRSRLAVNVAGMDF